MSRPTFLNVPTPLSPLCTAQKRKIRQSYKQKPSSSDEMVPAIVSEGSSGGRSKYAR